MLIVCHVCAEFHDKKGETVFTVSPELLNQFLTVPEEIREDPLFGMLVADGSLETGMNEKQKKTLERDPVAGVTAEGKKTSVTRKKTSEAETEPKADS